MGSLISSSIPNLISGVSQQPWNVRLPTQGEEQINCYSTITDFLRRRPAAKHIAKLTEPHENIATHSINRDEVEKYQVIATSASLQVFDLTGQEKTVKMDGSGPDYLASALNPERDLRFLTINDYTFVLNRKVTVKAHGDLSPKRPPEAIVFIKQASYNTTYTLTLDGAAKSFTTQDGVAPADQPADSLSSREIAQNLQGQIDADTYETSYSNSTIYIKRKDGADFKIKVEDSRSNTHTSLCKGRVQRFSDLPTVAPRGFVTEIVGDATSSFDNYFCVFEPTDANDSFGAGTWKETVKPGVAYKFDPAAMPHALIRQADGGFTFGPLEWDERTCGDDDSAPFPSFIDRTLGGLFFYRNRLAFMAGENVVMSETGEFFNFFVTTVTTMVDSDVIDVAASHIKSNILEHAAIFSGGLLLFSEQGQFTLEHDTVLSNATVSIKPVTEFEASMLAPPVSSGKTVFFTVDRSEYGAVREYFTMPDASEQNDAADVTAHIPRYIRGDIYRLICSSNEDILLALSAQKRDSIWAYKYFWNGSEKIQSAWCRWDMAGEVLGASFINTRLYLVMKYNDGIYLEMMNFAPGNKDEGEPIEYCLDRKVTEAECTLAAYDPVSKTTALTMPYPTAARPLVVTRSGAGAEGLPEADAGGSAGGASPSSDKGRQKPGRVMEIVEADSDARTFIVKGDLTGAGLFIGLPFMSTYVFSPMAIREDGRGNAITNGRLQLRNLTINCMDTGLLQTVVTPRFRPSSIYTFTGREVGHGANILGEIPLYTGVIKCPVLSLNSQVEVKVQSDSFMPFALVNATWEGFYNSRSQKI